jgi:hypothetical protein
MPVLAPLTLSAAYVLASLSAAQCPAQGAVDVDVQFVKQDNPVTTNLTSAQLTQQFGKRLDTSMLNDGRWMVGGVTVLGPSTLKEEIQLGFQSNTEVRTGDACFTVDKVTYKIVYTPEVYIASDYLKMGCRYSATVMHENRHVNTDVDLLTDEVPDIRKTIESFTGALGPQGPYAVGDVVAQKQRIAKAISDSVAPQWQEFVTLRRKKQAEIDTLANYQRDTALCPGQFPKFDGSQ